MAAANGRIPFDLTSLPLWRAVLAQVADEEFHLHLNLHQLVTDGVSLYRILLPELIALYSAFSQGRPSPLPGSAAQYGDFALWQRAQLTDQLLGPHLAWWKQKLAGPGPPVGWPGYKPRPPVQTYNGATELLFLPVEFVDPLRRFAEGESATFFMALAAGIFTLLHRYTGQTDLILGMPARDPSRNPLFQIMMSLEPPMPPIDPAWDLTQAGVSSGSAKADLYLNLDTRSDGMMVQIVYNPDLLEARKRTKHVCRLKSDLGSWNRLSKSSRFGAFSMAAADSASLWQAIAKLTQAVNQNR